MCKYKVIVFESAEADLEAIADYISINLQEPAVAFNLVGKIKDAIYSLETMPKRYSLVADSYLGTKGIRILPVDRYLIFYTVNESVKEIHIIRVLYGRREWEKLL